MPRAAGEGELEPVFPWKDWENQLVKAPNMALFFGPEDFGSMTPRRFRELARKAFKSHGVTASIRGDEVLVVINAS